MKIIINLLVTVFVIFLISSCVKSSNGLIKDGDNYFKVTFSGKTLESDGYLYMGASIPSGYAYVNSSNNQYGTVVSNLTIQITNNENIAWGIPPTDCNCYISLSKIGNALGNYTIDKFSGNYITDLNSGNKRYDIDSIGSFNITKADATLVVGTFTCKLIDGTSKIPAVGSFSLHKQ